MTVEHLCQIRCFNRILGCQLKFAGLKIKYEQLCKKKKWQKPIQYFKTIIILYGYKLIKIS